MKEKKCGYDIERDGSSVTVILRGEMDHHNAVTLRGDIDGMIYEYRPSLVVIDLSEIGFMDSSGLGFVMGRYALMKKLGGELILRDPNDRVVKIFELAGLDRIVRIENSRKEKIK